MRGYYWKPFLLDDDRRGVRIRPRSAMQYSPTPLPIASLLGQPSTMCRKVGRDEIGKEALFFISLSIVL
jgi:hypothetical protein